MLQFEELQDPKRNAKSRRATDGVVFAPLQRRGLSCPFWIKTNGREESAGFSGRSKLLRRKDSE